MINGYTLVAMAATASALVVDCGLTQLFPLYCVSVLLCLYCMELCRQQSGEFIVALIAGIALLAFVRQDFWFIAWCLPLTYATLVLKRLLPPFAWLPALSIAAFVIAHTVMRAFMQGAALIPFLRAYALPAIAMNLVIMVIISLLFSIRFRYAR